MPASKWDLACEHLNALNEQSGGQAGEGQGWNREGEAIPAGAQFPGSGLPPPGTEAKAESEWVDLFAPDAAERLGLTLVKGTG